LRYGSYQQLRLLLYLLHQNGIAVSFAPPKKQIKHFSRMMMPVTKTDEKDAYMIAMYGEKMNPPIYKMPSQATYGSLPPKGLPTLTMQSNYPASSEYVQPINNQEHP